MNIKNLKLVDLDRSSLCQSRVSTDPERLLEYQLAWEKGAEFPPCVVYQDGDKYYIADGFHRIQSKMKAAVKGKIDYRTIECDVRLGTMQDAITYSLGANLRHGLRPNTADKKRSILLYYSLSADNCYHSNNQVSQVVGCSHTFVGGWKATVITTPIEVVFADVQIPRQVLRETIDNLKIAVASGKIVTNRNGKMLEQGQKSFPAAPKIASERRLTQELPQLPIETKPVVESALYMVTTTAANIPRGTVIEGLESLTSSGNITTDWEMGTEVIASADLIKIPFEIDAMVTPVYGEKKHTVTGYSLVGSDLRVHSIDHLGFECKHSSEMLKRFIKKDAVEKSTTPILDLKPLSTEQLRDLIAVIGREIYRRANLPQDVSDLTIS